MYFCTFLLYLSNYLKINSFFLLFVFAVWRRDSFLHSTCVDPMWTVSEHDRISIKHSRKTQVKDQWFYYRSSSCTYEGCWKLWLYNSYSNVRTKWLLTCRRVLLVISYWQKLYLVLQSHRQSIRKMKKLTVMPS